MCVTPGSKRSKCEKYREAWKLMKPAAAASKSEAPTAGNPAKGEFAIVTA
jgi:hypothetical protein